MSDEIKLIEKETDELDRNYLENLKTLKENSVPKEKYQKVLEDNKRLQEIYINQDSSVTVVSKEDEFDEGKAINDFFGNEQDNLAFAKKMIRIRQAEIDAGRPDPFVGVGHKNNPSPSDFDTAQRVADVLQECIDSCGDDSAVFTAQVMSRTREGLPMMK